MDPPQGDADRGVGLGPLGPEESWGIDDFLPRNHGELYGIMMFYGDLHMKRFDWIYESSSWVFRFLGLIGSKPNGSPTMKNRLNW